MKIHESLRELRLSRNLTQEQVAEKLNVTRQTISSFETGRTRPDIDTLIIKRPFTGCFFISQKRKGA